MEIHQKAHRAVRVWKAAALRADMTNREFLYWLQGYFELDAGAARAFTDEQLRLIRNHLNLVKHVDGQLAPFPQKLESLLDSGAKLDEKTVAMLARELDALFDHGAGDPPDPLLQTMC
jgi:hypothetical protein